MRLQNSIFICFKAAQAGSLSAQFFIEINHHIFANLKTSLARNDYQIIFCLQKKKKIIKIKIKIFIFETQPEALVNGVVLHKAKVLKCMGVCANCIYK